jgi:hypothetical protein
MEWNDYSYGIPILLFGKGLFQGIAIPLEYLFPYEEEYLFLFKMRGIAIPCGIDNIFQKNTHLFYFFLKK